MNMVLLKTKIEESKQRVLAAEAELEAGMQKVKAENGGETTVMATLLEHAFATLRDARRHLADLVELLPGEVEAARPEERNCPACNKMIRANARMCGYCWRKLV